MPEKPQTIGYLVDLIRAQSNPERAAKFGDMLYELLTEMLGPKANGVELPSRSCRCIVTVGPGGDGAVDIYDYDEFENGDEIDARILAESGTVE